MGLLVVEAASVLNVLNRFQEPIPHTGLPCSVLVQGNELIIPQLDMPCFFHAHEGPACFQMKAEEEWIGKLCLKKVKLGGNGKK